MMCGICIKYCDQQASYKIWYELVCCCSCLTAKPDHDTVRNIQLRVMNCRRYSYGCISSSAAQKPTISMSLLFPYNLPQLFIPGDHPPCMDPHIHQIFRQSLVFSTLLLSLSLKAMVLVILLLSILCTCPAYCNPAAAVLLIISCDP
jgi:hypothetical protein